MRKADIQTHGVGYGSRQLPAVNVKVYKWWDDVTEDEWRGLHAEIADGFDSEWMRAHVPESVLESFWSSACEDGFEQAELALAEIFDDYGARYALKVSQEGRSGGWLVVNGLPDLESWDAVMVGKWSKFVRECDAIVADIPRACAWLIGVNVYEAELTAFRHAELQRDNINADAIAALKVG